MVDPSAPIIHSRKASQSGAHQLWVRLGAFLSMRAPNTQDTYRGIVREFCSFLGAKAGSAEAAQKLIAATDMHAMAYRAWLERRAGETPRLLRKSRAAHRDSQTRALQESKTAQRQSKKTGLEHSLSNATIAKKFAALRRIYRMFQASSLGVRENPFDQDRVPAPPKEAGRKRPTEMLDFEIVRQVIETPDPQQPKGLRDRAILAVLFGAGLRRSELVNLRMADVRQTAKGTTYLYLRSTKAKKDAQAALPKWAAVYVLELIEQRREQRASLADYLFVSYQGQGAKSPTLSPISASGIYKLFKYYCQRAGAGEFVTPHSARATAITRLLAAGVSHRRVQEFSRHASIQMVEAYDKRRLSVDENPASELDYEE